MQNPHSEALSVGEVVKGLRSAIVDMQSQIDDLKQDKRDLRFDKEAMKIEMARSKEELNSAQAKASETAQELLRAMCEAEFWKQQCETVMKEQEARNSISHYPASVQTDGDSGSDYSAINLNHARTEATPPDPNPSEVSSNNVCIEILSSPSTSTTSLALDATTAPPVTFELPLVDGDITMQAPANQTRKRKAITSEGLREGEGAQKRIATGEHPVQHAPTQDIPTPEWTALDALPNRGRPVVPFNEDEAFVLPPHILASYLNSAPPLNITPSPSDLHVSRKFLAGAYGGSPRGDAQHITALDNPSGDRHRAFIFPAFDLNPGMPLVPGQSGVIVGPRIDRKTGCSWGLFRKDISGTSETWVYLGEYEWSAAGQMSVEIFRSQKEKVKKKWANGLLSWKRDLSDYYVSMRARIALRKARILPASSQYAERKQVKEEIEKIRLQTGHPVSQKDIITAFERGDEMVDIDLLRCVSYDRTLALDIEAKFRQPPPKVKRKTKSYSYPSRFTSTSGLTSGYGVKGKRPARKVQSGMANSSSSSLPTSTTANDQHSSFAEGTESAVATAATPRQSTRDANDGMVFVGEEEDDDMSNVSDDDMEELCYPD